MTVKQLLERDIVYLDGGMGTMLQSAGLSAGEDSADWLVTRPQTVRGVHESYLAAGADIVAANTFGINVFKYGDRCAELVKLGVGLAKAAAKGFKDKFVALDVGPTGKLLKPLGDLGFEEAVEAFKVCVRAGAEAGADIVLIETMNDIYEAKAAVLAAKEACDLPVFATCVFGADGKTMTGSSPEIVAAVLGGLGVDALGLNCSLSPAEMFPVCERLVKCSRKPVIVKPNAGLPAAGENGAAYSVDGLKFAEDMQKIVALGVKCVGGCCGTTPAYIRLLKEKTAGVKPPEPVPFDNCLICSYSRSAEIGGAPVIIGERINPTGKKRLKEALKGGDCAYILGEAVAQEEAGAHALDVNVGLPEIDESKLLPEIVYEIQSVTSLPLQIDTSSPAAMEGALRIYNGKPLVNSVDGKEDSLRAVLPLVKKYGGAVIALTLDENGIPPTAEGRLEIARRILARAEEYGIDKRDVIFDTLATTVAADGNAANVTLESLVRIKAELGANVSLGVSNISYGLPQRETINSTFLATALAKGLSAAIINPLSAAMMKVYYSYCALSGSDAGCLNYIDFASRVSEQQVKVAAKAEVNDRPAGLEKCIIRGLKSEAADCAEELLRTRPPIEVINGYIVPALDEVGRGFEEKRVFLPQLMMSAEAAAAAFDRIKRAFSGGGSGKKLKIVIATVKGDVHDIGKNIVKSLLENYGFTVCDLGKDVPPEEVVAAVKRTGARLVGLSALMTTTVGSMRNTIITLRKECPGCKIIVGGAVLTDEYAKEIGADAYSQDAMGTVRYAESLEKLL